MQSFAFCLLPFAFCTAVDPMTRRLVVKIGTSLLTRQGGHLDKLRMARFVADLARAQKSGIEVVLVTSGAIAAGMSELGWSKRPAELAKKQAAAAVGQPRLMETYRQLFKRRGIRVAQVLLTREDFDNKHRRLNAQATILTLLREKVVPIINENDSVGVEEIRVGDNDTLAARVAVKVEADLLILLTDVDGLMTRPPKDGKGELIHRITKITPAIEALANGSASGRGTGGMQTKLSAARYVTSRGITLIIANGRRPSVVTDLLQQKPIGSLFVPT